MFPDPLEVDRPGTAQAGPAGSRQSRESSPPIGGATCPLDEAFLDQAVDKARQTAAAEADPLGQLRHPKAAVGGHPELDEDVELGKGHVLLFDEFRLQLAQQGGLGIEKGGPGTQFGRFKLGCHAE